jgi:hypothetical protein
MPFSVRVQRKDKKGAMITHDAFNVYNKFVAGRAGFEPATNGLKVPLAVSMVQFPFHHFIRLPEIYPCSARLMDE